MNTDKEKEIFKPSRPIKTSFPAPGSPVISDKGRKVPLKEPKLQKEQNEKKETDEKIEKKLNISFDFNEDKYIIYAFLFYICGLVGGSSFYKAASSETLNKLLKPADCTLINLFFSNMCIYLTLFLIIIFLGMCLIGYPVINIIPALIGIEYGLKLAYFYVNYSVKGVGYSLLMIVPFSAMFITVIAYTMKNSAKMSKMLMDMTKKESSVIFNVKPYLKNYAILGAVIIAMSFVSAVITTLFFEIVTI